MIERVTDAKTVILAEESPKTTRAREKLRKQLEAEKQKITPSELRNKSDEMHRLIARNASNRETLPKKAFTLFDGGQNPADPSLKIVRLAQQLRANAPSGSNSVE